MTRRNGSSVTVKARAISAIWRLPIEQIGDLVVGANAVTGEDLVELLADQGAGARLPARAPQAAVHDADVLGDRQVGAEREFLEHAADAAGAALPPTPVGHRLARQRPIVPSLGRQRSGQNVHERRLAGAVVADKPQAFACARPEGRRPPRHGRRRKTFRRRPVLSHRLAKRLLARDDLCRILGRVLDIGNAALFRGGQIRFQSCPGRSAGRARSDPSEPPCRRGSSGPPRRRASRRRARSRPTWSHSHWHPSVPSTTAAHPGGCP